VINTIVEHKEVILVALLAVSELLAVIPSVKSNSVFQLVFNGLKKAKEFLTKKAE